MVIAMYRIVPRTRYRYLKICRGEASQHELWRVCKKCVCSLYSTNTLTITDSIYIHLSRSIILTVWDSEWWMLSGEAPRAPHTFPSFLLLFLPTHRLQKCAARNMHFAAKMVYCCILGIYRYKMFCQCDCSSVHTQWFLIRLLLFGKVKPLVSLAGKLCLYTKILGTPDLCD